MISVNARATFGLGEVFKPVTIDRRDPGPHDVLIEIAYAGICHSDIHQARSSSATKPFPMVPGHEIAGTVSAVGSEVIKFSVGDRAGVGCYVDTCRECNNCRAGLEQFCNGYVSTYGSIGRDGQITYGGYSEMIVVDERYVVRIPDSLSLQNAAPLLCAGITLYSPLRRWNAGPGKRVAILGFGGLGHVGVQISKALGSTTTVLDLSLDKQDDGLRLGADEYRATTDSDTFTDLAESFDLILSTVPANFDLDPYLGLLGMGGALVCIGQSEKPVSLPTLSLRHNERAVVGTKTGGMPQTQEMINFCGEHSIGAEVEVIHADNIDDAYDRVVAGDVKFRFVIDNGTLDGSLLCRTGSMDRLQG